MNLHVTVPISGPDNISFISVIISVIASTPPPAFSYQNILTVRELSPVLLAV